MQKDMTDFDTFLSRHAFEGMEHPFHQNFPLSLILFSIM